MKDFYKILPIAIIVSLFFVNATSSYYSSRAVVESNTYSTGTWEIPEEPSVVGPGDVVINEVMWTGTSGKPTDQWIELRNMTEMDIDIGQWKIENARAAGQPDLMVPANGVIPAGGYFLIANYPRPAATTNINVDIDMVNASISLADLGNGHLVLKDPDGNVIDSAKGDEWPAGGVVDGVLWYSMQRVADPGDGLDSDNWYVCDSTGCNSGTYWKTVDGPNYGTPGHENI
jgi:hypothetical protein